MLELAVLAKDQDQERSLFLIRASVAETGARGIRPAFAASPLRRGILRGLAEPKLTLRR